MIGRSHGHTDLEAGLEAHHAAKLQRTSSSLARETLGEKVVAVVLIAPTLLNWLVLAEAQLVSTAQLVDSDGVTHIVQRSRTVNFEQFFFAASATCVSTVSAHVWLTMGAIARRHTLGQTCGGGGRDAQRNRVGACCSGCLRLLFCGIRCLLSCNGRGLWQRSCHGNPAGCGRRPHRTMRAGPRTRCCDPHPTHKQRRLRWQRASRLDDGANGASPRARAVRPHTSHLT